jgi:hypothetical protein
MVKIQLAPSVSQRLASFLQFGTGIAPRSSHWEYFSGLNHITVDAANATADFSAGAGFDSSYELNFRRRTLAETAAQCWLDLRGLNPDSRFADAFFKLWPGNPLINSKAAEDLLRPPMTAHKYLAAHYANLLLRALPAAARTTYVEIGPGAGYLAALIHRHRPGLLILIDLPDILPYSFLALHQAFPDSPFLLPNELDGDPVTLPERGMVFLTADQANRLPAQCMDIGVNTASFGEMLPELVDHYFKLLRQISKPDGLFFTCNRVEKWMDAAGNPLVGAARQSGHPLRFDNYPWQSGDRDRFYGKSEFHDLVQPSNPMLQRLCHLAPAPG